MSKNVYISIHEKSIGIRIFILQIFLTCTIMFLLFLFFANKETCLPPPKNVSGRQSEKRKERDWINKRGKVFSKFNFLSSFDKTDGWLPPPLLLKVSPRAESFIYNTQQISLSLSVFIYNTQQISLSLSVLMHSILSEAVCETACQKICRAISNRIKTDLYQLYCAFKNL